MAVITMPTGGISRVSWTLPQHPDYGVTSRWTGKTQVVDIGATTGFRAQVEIIPGKESHLLKWRAFFAELRGRTNTFYLAAHTNGTSATGAINGAGQTGYGFINLDGLPPTSSLKEPGALVHIASSVNDHRLFVLTWPLATNSSGAAATRFEPAIVTAYPDNAVVQYGAPLCHMRLATPVTGWGQDPGAIYRPFAFECEEVI
jgi:hypothetical protein